MKTADEVFSSSFSPCALAWLTGGCVGAIADAFLAGQVEGPVSRSLTGFLFAPLPTLLSGAAATAAYACWRAGRRRVVGSQALLAAQLEQRRIGVEQAMALRARLNPDFIFDYLDFVATTYSTDRARGEAVLDDLIAALQAIQPASAEESSTIEQEFRIARVLLRLRQHRGDFLDVRFTAPAAAGQAVIGPMLVTPLVLKLFELPGAVGVAWVMSAEVVDSGIEGSSAQRLELRLAPAVETSSTATFAPADLPTLNCLRRRVEQLHGAGASFLVTFADGKPTFSIDAPLPT